MACLQTFHLERSSAEYVRVPLGFQRIRYSYDTMEDIIFWEVWSSDLLLALPSHLPQTLYTQHNGHMLGTTPPP